MKARLWLAGLSLLSPYTASTLAQSAPIVAAVAVVGTIQVKTVSISAIDASHVEVAVNLILVPGQSATLKDVQLCSLHLNGLPVFAAPLHQEIAMRKGEELSLPAVFVSLFYRDLTTVHPLIQMLDKQTVHVEAELVSGLQVGFLGKLALHSEHPKIVVPISQEVAVEVGGTPFARNLAIGVLQSLDHQMAGDSTPTKLIDKLRPVWIRNLEAQAKANLFVVDSRYSLSEGKIPYQVDVEALGFRTASGRIATSAEMLNPWKYDAEFLGEINGGSVGVVKNSQDIRLQPLAAIEAAQSLGARDFKTDPRGNAEGERVTTVGKKRDQVRLMRRASPSLLLVLTPSAPITETGLTSAPASILSQDAWDKVLVFRRRTSPTTGEHTVDALEMGARRDGGGIRLSEPVDEAVFGSPILTPDGVIGLVQDEQTGTFLPEDVLKAAVLPKVN
ncbi:MAG TPA: hypothetical protein VG225_02935 [Terracidiphilus sp.]|jgi:hypothetical protein|nr:hypothetical protein [Terracidiphilus sp.]